MPPRCQLLSGSLPRPAKYIRSAALLPRTFATTAPRHGPKGGDLGSHLPVNVIPRDANIPPYPYGPSLLYRQSNKGLYGGQRIQFGNNVSPDTKTKTRRHWKPNVLSKALYSAALNRKIKLRITSKVLKTMDREGGLDEYLLKESEVRIKELGPLGWALRWTLMQQPEIIARFRAQAAALGLAQDVIDKQWPKVSPAREETKERAQARVESEVVAAKEQYDRRTMIAEKRLDNWNKETALQRWADKCKRMRVAPDTNFARAMAVDERAKITREIKWAGGESSWKAWRKAKRNGRVEAAGGDEAWFAHRRADELMKKQQRQVEAEKKWALLQEQGRRDAERKDEWGAVINAKKGAARLTV
ncbi:hypothetical protein BU24DRAFT_420001 [Aaosphaeria arxii CBS 175.79]|uniref:Large ribosomal subunit protein bL28m n=1 Tax=Aaosphaeria arxii CBS 175.79 TaxID=1450172 RepID=A0A6A5XWF2_9PLEO|nr:uncharacterized protein BU24DRAFT_420001 [Aaosphaeria arxii CBS 175.79]KAF2016960.1 hypothetical protein BU24DRAFT_420001 [Aaosphaeria arxii CBS 175.79]